MYICNKSNCNITKINTFTIGNIQSKINFYFNNECTKKTFIQFIFIITLKHQYDLIVLRISLHNNFFKPCVI